MVAAEALKVKVSVGKKKRTLLDDVEKALSGEQYIVIDFPHVFLT